MNTKAITIYYDPKNVEACNVKVNNRFLKSGTNSKANVIEKAMSWLQGSYVKIAHQLLEGAQTKSVVAVEPAVAPLKRKRGRPAKALQMEAQATGTMMKRRRGRPARINVNPAAIMANIEQIATGKRGVGRPRKIVTTSTATATEMPSLV